MAETIEPGIDVSTWWSEERCPHCGTVFRYGVKDIEVDQFRALGTYWFDGSADAAGLTTKWFVHCPSKADCDIIIVDGRDNHTGIERALHPLIKAEVPVEK